MNLAGVADWSSEIIFADAFKASRPWIQPEGLPGAASARAGRSTWTPHGWINKLADKQFAEALIYMDIGNHYPGGKYVCVFDGNGELEFSNAAQGKPAGPNKYAVDVDTPAASWPSASGRPTPRTRSGTSTSSRPSSRRPTQTSPFLPEFVNRYKGFQVIRFMDWQKTNNSNDEKWEKRARATTPRRPA